MEAEKRLEFFVGIFVLLGIASLVFLAFEVSGLTLSSFKETYTVTAQFENIGGLKVRSPVSMAGVNVGEVTSITLDPKTYNAVVTMQMFGHNIPEDSSASILTQGLLGSNYVGLVPGFSDQFLKTGSKIEETHPALILENLIGQFLFNVNQKDEKKGA